MSALSPSVRVILSGVRSVTHLVYAASWLRHLVEDVAGVVEVVVLDVGAGFGRTRVDDAVVRRYLPSNPRLQVTTEVDEQHWHPGVGLDLVLLSIGLPGTRAWTRLVAAGRGRRPRVVVVDEGIGSFGNVSSRRAAYRRQGGGPVRASVRAAVVSTAGRVLTDLHWPLYERVGGTWTVRDEVAAEFRRGLGGPAPAPNTAVYLTQPWPDVGVMSEAGYRDHLQAVREQCGDAGLELALRPHPSEPVERYDGFDLVAGTLPAELDRRVVVAPVVIGSNSTALLNLAAIHGTSTVRVTAPGLASLEAALTPGQRSLLDTFLAPSLSVDALGRRLETLRAGGDR